VDSDSLVAYAEPMADERDDNGEAGYRAPKLAINRVYTRKGDAGRTALVGGMRLAKNHARIEAYGTVDELNAFVGAARASLDAAALAADCKEPQALRELATVLLRVQHELFNLGGLLATPPDQVDPKQPRVSDVDVKALEDDIDRRNLELTPLRSFVLPGGCRANADLHLARVVCRRAERLCVGLAQEEAVDGSAIAYLNRLSDALFVHSRWVSLKLGAPESLWQPKQGSSGGGPT
jgi:cob(I)alamin adenosyltransferase